MIFIIFNLFLLLISSFQRPPFHLLYDPYFWAVMGVGVDLTGEIPKALK